VSAILFTIGTWTAYVATICGFVVICYYTLVAKWWRKPEGRLVMSWVLWTFSCLAFISLRLSTILSQQGGLVVRIIIYGVPIYLFVWLAIRIAKAQAAPLQKGEVNPSERVPLSLTEIEPQKRWRRKS
jgi:hypothetical protein